MGDHPLTGRTREVAALQHAVALAAHGATVFVDVRGEPGIGKTSLLDELVRIAARHGFAVRAGRGQEVARQRPFGPFAGMPSLLPTALMVERYRLHRAFAAELERAAGERGLLLILDDLHWADSASYELLSHLLRHPPEAPLVIAAAYRPRQAPALLHAALQKSHARHIRLDVGPLSREAVAELVGEREAERRHAESGGNPFHLWAGVPMQEFAQLDRPAATVAAAIAVGGDGLDPRQVAHLAGLPIEDTLAALDTLAARDLIGHDLAFRHPLLRQAAYRHADPDWLAGAHARAAEWLRSRGAPATELAHHVERSARPGDARAAATLIEAAQLALAGAPASATHWLGAALRLIPDGDADPALLHTLARALHVQGRIGESRRLLRRLVPAMPWGGERGSTVFLCVTLDQIAGDRGAATALLESELAAPPEQEAYLARVRLNLAMIHADSGEAERAGAWAGLVIGSGQRLYEAGAHAVLAVVAAERAFSDAVWHARHATALVDGLLDGELAGALEVAMWAAEAAHVTECFPDAIRHLTRALPLARSTGQNVFAHAFLLQLAGSQFWTGRLTEAWQSAVDALEIAELLQSPEMVCVTLARQCQIALDLGEVELAVRLGERACAEDRHRRAMCAGLLAMARLAAGDAEGALRDLRAALPGMATARLPHWYDVLVQAELRLGRVAQARLWADEAAALSVPAAYGYARLAAARVHAAAGDPRLAAAAAGEAATRFAETGVPMVEAQARLVAGSALADLGESTAAHHELSRARDLFTACGSPHWRDQARGELRRLGARRPRRATGEALTERERDIAVLLRQGLSNRQIAARLRVSTRTVETHLGRIYRKLGVANRAGLVSRLAG
ncbi:helix-turn-helix transcriptional regulator [Nonomuraea sediminis]|uniref:helix-turn-helix transcriptional regulator n=1 Tax=Nonomuraea sediminis TaxID=2835864 RepID=UPI001BDD359F|nr:LuxR family transcriptional regulator [Nonomuraea sediminis]